MAPDPHALEFVPFSPQPIRLWHERLVVLCGSERRPLGALEPQNDVHGGLRLEFGGRLVPALGASGPDDVSIPAWLGQFWKLAELCEGDANGSVTYDEGEDGQPAFVFGRAGQRGYFSIGRSASGRHPGLSDWQAIPFLPADFVAEHRRFRAALFAELRAAAPNTADAWIKLHDPAEFGSPWSAA